MKWKRRLVGVSILMLLYAAFFFAERMVTFENLNQAKIDIAAAGYHCTSDRADGHLGVGFLVTREPIHWQEVTQIHKTRTSGPAWKGKIWVAALSPRMSIEFEPNDSNLRSWGRVVAFGDQALLNEIESTLKRGGRNL